MFFPLNISIKKTIYTAFILLFTISCNRNSSLLKTDSYNNIKLKDVMSALNTRNLDFDELKAKFKVKADLNGNIKTFIADIRWKNQDQIWMSFSIFGIEGVRALFTPDSVKIINKLENEYFFGDYKALEQISQVALSFAEIENLLLGKLFGVKDKKPFIQFAGNNAIIELEDELYTAKAEVSKENLSIQHYLITSLLGKKSLDVTLSEYQQIENKNWPTKRNYNIVSENNYLKIDATSQKVTLNETLEYPFNINPKYERIPLQFLK